ncbi:MAG: hypothetical protein P8Z70_05890 [Desulfuromonadales bacterium]
MVRMSWKVYTALALVGLSLLLCLAHVALFHDARALAFSLGVGVAFVPVQVLLVTLIIERLLNEREKQALIKKLNMVIGAFMSEVGAGFLRRVDAFCGEEPDLARNLTVTEQWGKAHYRQAARVAEAYQAHLSADDGQLAELRDFLLARRPFVLGLLQNPNLLEHDSFTDLLWAVCHLTEELEARTDFSKLPETDLQHLYGDIRRANSTLIREWLGYMRHLQADYPYMFSLATRMNPFNPEASAVVYG